MDLEGAARPDRQSGVLAVVTPERVRDAVALTQRNGFARTVGEIDELMQQPPLERRPHLALSLEHEQALRDADAQQLGALNVPLALHGEAADWRLFLKAHFFRAFRIVLSFDAPSTERRPVDAGEPPAGQ